MEAGITSSSVENAHVSFNWLQNFAIMCHSAGGACYGQEVQGLLNLFTSSFSFSTIDM